MHHRPHDAATAAGQAAPFATPLKNETPGVASAPGSQEIKADTPNSTDITAERKAQTTSIVRYAIAGFELVKLAGGIWEARRWDLVKPLAKIADVEAWLNCVGGPNA
jgi:hypothetical protein